LDHLDGDLQPGSAVFIINTPNTDRDGDNVRLTEASFKEWQASGAPWFAQHESNKIGVGSSIGPDGELRVWQEDGKWYAKCYFDLSDEGSRRVYQALKTHRLGAASVGFIPDPAQTRSKRGGGQDYYSPTITEVSIVGIPANAEAVLQTVKGWRGEIEKWRVQADSEGSDDVPWTGSGDGRPDGSRREVLDRYAAGWKNDPIEGSQAKDMTDDRGERLSLSQVLAALYSHAKAELAYLDYHKADVGDYTRQHVEERMERLRSQFAEANPDGDLDSAVQKFERDANSGATQTGEALLVDQGKVPPEKRKAIAEKFREVKRAVVEAKIQETIAKLRQHGYV
jgi:hypothetical protein